jgi:hypothetical protein
MKGWEEKLGLDETKKKSLWLLPTVPKRRLREEVIHLPFLGFQFFS